MDSTSPVIPQTVSNSSSKHHYTVLLATAHQKTQDYLKVLEENNIDPTFLGQSAIFLDHVNPTRKPWSNIVILPDSAHGSAQELASLRSKLSQAWSFKVESDSLFDGKFSSPTDSKDIIKSKVPIDKQLEKAMKTWRQKGRETKGGYSRLYALGFVKLPSEHAVTAHKDYYEALAQACENAQFGLKVHLFGTITSTTPMQELDNSARSVKKSHDIDGFDVFTLMSFPDEEHFTAFRSFFPHNLTKKVKDESDWEIVGNEGFEEGAFTTVEEWAILTRKVDLVPKKKEVKPKVERIGRKRKTEIERLANPDSGVQPPKLIICEPPGQDWFG